MDEWLTQYTAVSERHQELLKQTLDMRQKLENREEQLMQIAIKRMHSLQQRRDNRKKLTKPKDIELRRADQTDKLHVTLAFQNDSGFCIAPNRIPRRLNPVTRNRNSEDTKLKRMTTEFETIQAIDKRNKLKLSSIFHNNLSSDNNKPYSNRQPLNVSIVTLHSIPELLGEVDSEIGIPPPPPTEYSSHASSVGLHTTNMATCSRLTRSPWVFERSFVRIDSAKYDVQ